MTIIYKIKLLSKKILFKIPFGITFWQIIRAISLLKEKSFRELFFEIKSNDICLDIGANIGHASLVMWLKGAKYIYALEPNIKANHRLKKNLLFLKNICIYNFAIGSETKKQKLFLHRAVVNTADHEKVLEYSQASSLISEKRNIGNCFYEVEAITFKDLFNKLNFVPNVIKCDIEGGEYLIYEQIIEIALKYKIRKIFVECHANKYKEFERPHKRFLKLIKENNLELTIDTSWH